MVMSTDLRLLHRRALDVAGGVVARVQAVDLVRPSPCLGWDLGALLGHAVGQNHGFAQAVEEADAPLESFVPRPVPADELCAAWQESADRLATAFAAAPLDREVLLVEISPEIRFPLATVVGFHLLDTVVHTWDIATALGEEFRPDDELVAATFGQAQRVPGGEARERPGA
ncbi:MAG: TIGR03086 family protein, partial [Pseudonocardiales bacterium]